jgi:hypothetical protein
MTPATLAKSNTEHAHQVALFAWAAIAEHQGFDVANMWAFGGLTLEAAKATGMVLPVPELHWFFAIPNGGSRGDDEKTRAIRGGALKAEGVRSGVSDTFLAVKRGEYSGLFIEMKKPSEKPVKATSKGGVSDEQRSFGEFVKTQGFGFVVCYSWIEAVENLTAYLNWGSK